MLPTLLAAVSAGSAPITFLPLSTQAACLDGGPYGFYFVPSPSASTKWTVYLQGGGWCVNETDCLGRAHTILGNSSMLHKTGGCTCMNTAEGGLDNSCNCIYLPYW
jgi:hypothetical protein